MKSDEEISRLLSEHWELADTIAAKYFGRGHDNAEVLSRARLALLEAVRKYDWDSAASFPTFIKQTIKYRLIDYFRRINYRPDILDKDGFYQGQQRRGGNYEHVSLDYREHADDSPLAHRVTDETVVEPWRRLVDTENQIDAAAIVRDAPLNDDEDIVIELYFFEGLKLWQIARIMGVTESRISQIKNSALNKMRSMIKI